MVQNPRIQPTPVTQYVSPFTNIFLSVCLFLFFYLLKESINTEVTDVVTECRSDAPGTNRVSLGQAYPFIFSFNYI